MLCFSEIDAFIGILSFNCIAEMNKHGSKITGCLNLPTYWHPPIQTLNIALKQNWGNIIKELRAGRVGHGTPLSWFSLTQCEETSLTRTPILHSPNESFSMEYVNVCTKSSISQHIICVFCYLHIGTLHPSKGKDPFMRKCYKGGTYALLFFVHPGS